MQRQMEINARKFRHDYFMAINYKEMFARSLRKGTGKFKKIELHYKILLVLMIACFVIAYFVCV